MLKTYSFSFIERKLDYHTLGRVGWCVAHSPGERGQSRRLLMTPDLTSQKIQPSNVVS